MKIYIVGSGGVGGYLGGLLAIAGNDVTFLARGQHYQAIKENGLQINAVKGDFLVKPAKVISSSSEITNPDLVIFTVKTYDTESTAIELSKVVNENTAIITFQNGVENDLKIKQFIKVGKIFPGVAYLISTKVGPGTIEQIGGPGGIGKFVIGDRNGSFGDLLGNITMVMKNAGIDASVSEDITQDVWKKFVFISAFSGMTAFYGKPIGGIVNDARLKDEYENCVKETIAVAKSLKVNLPEDTFETTMSTTIKTNPASKSSLLVDVEKGGKNEIETLNGKVVRYAKQQNIQVPINEKIYEKIKNKLNDL